MLRMAMVIATIGKAGLNFMGAIVGERDAFVNRLEQNDAVTVDRNGVSALLTL